MIGLGCGESIGSSVVKRFGSPSGAGTNTRCGRFGSGNFGPPERGSFTISRFVMISPRRARLVERRALKDRATGGSEQGRARVSTAAEAGTLIFPVVGTRRYWQRRHELVEVPRPLRLVRALHLEQVHVMGHPTVLSDFAVLGKKVVDRGFLHDLHYAGRLVRSGHLHCPE